MRITNINQLVNQVRYAENYQYAFAKYKCPSCRWCGEHGVKVKRGQEHYMTCPKCGKEVNSET